MAQGREATMRTRLRFWSFKDRGLPTSASARVVGMSERWGYDELRRGRPQSLAQRKSKSA